MLNRMLSLIITLLIASPSGLFQAAKAQAVSKPASQDQPVRLKTDLFEVRAVVTDKKGKVIDGLKMEDFEVLENNRPQRIEFFSEEVIPQKTSRDRTPAVSITPNLDLLRRPPGRTVVMFVDTLHLSPTSYLIVKQTLRKFIQEQLTDNDLAAIVTSGGQMGLFNQFTRDRRLLYYAVDKIALGSQSLLKTNLTPYISAAIERGDRRALEVGIEILKYEEGLEIVTGDGLAMSSAMLEQIVRSRAKAVLSQAASYRKAALLTLKALVDRMADMPGQRIIALLSDGFTLSDGGLGYDTAELNKVTSRANASGVSIYSLYAKGLTVDPVIDASRRPPSLRILADFNSYLRGSEKDQQQSLNALAKDTGGEAFFNSNDLAGLLKDVLVENAIYYTLAYYPATEQKNKNEYRKISVRVKNHPDYQVRAQKGYFASDLNPEKSNQARTPQQRLIDAVSSPLPATGIGVALSADYVEADSDDAQATVQVHISAETLDYIPDGDKYAVNLELLVFVFDQSGKVAHTISREVKGSLTAERVKTAKENGMKFVARVGLKPGVYQVRAGVREEGSERIGTGMALVEVADLKNKKLAMSGLVLTEPQLGGRQVENGEDRDLSNAKLTPGIAVYKAGGEMICTFMAYNAVREEHGREVQMQVSLVHEGKVVYEGNWNSLKESIVSQGSKGLTVSKQLSLPVKAGLYELQVKLQDSKSKKVTQQAALFEIIS